MINIRHTIIFLKFLGGRTLSSLDPGPRDRSNFKSFLEKPSSKCQRTHIIQNLFHGAYIIFVFLFFSTGVGGGGGEPDT